MVTLATAHSGVVRAPVPSHQLVGILRVPGGAKVWFHAVVVVLASFQTVTGQVSTKGGLSGGWADHLIVGIIDALSVVWVHIELRRRVDG